MKRKRGHYCWMCGRHRPNERFSGKGHARHLCKECSKLPESERERVQNLRNLEQMWEQRNISPQNIAMLEALAQSPELDVQRMAGLLLEVARVHPGKRKRIGYLAHHAPDLLRRLEAYGLVLPLLPEPMEDDYERFLEFEEWARNHGLDFDESEFEEEWPSTEPLPPSDWQDHDIPF